MASSNNDRNLIKQRGNTTITELPRQFDTLRYTKSTKRTFKGTKEDIEAKRDELVEDGYQCVVTEGPLYTLDATIPGKVDADTDEFDNFTRIQAQYEFTTNSVLKDLLESTHPLVYGGYDAANETMIDPLEVSHVNTLKSWLKQGTDEPPTFDYYMGTGYLSDNDINPGDATYFVTQYDQANRVYGLLASGVRSIEVPIPIVKRTFQYPPAYENIDELMPYEGKVISTNELKTSLGVIPEWLDFRLSEAQYNQSDPDVPPALVARAEIVKHYGWLQKTTVMADTSEGRISVSQEFTFGLWAADIYGPAY